MSALKLRAEMLQSIRKFFDRNIRTTEAAPGRGAEHALQVATAALLFETMRTDGEMKDAERHAVTAAVQKRFSLSKEETNELLRLAEAEAAQATDYFQFTALINEHYTAAQKEQIVENLWQVAAADHEIDRFERTLVHKVADLLYVPRPAQIAARERAMRGVHQSSK
ncbi:MAG: TerB family tellurite resistance protein [Pseudomonadota bacterium]|nr:MAG: TerB family tellurite resistance protein [Pseudomonadota bacterium]